MGAFIAALLAAISIHPVVCPPTWEEYDRAAGLPPGTIWDAGVGGYYR